jgi:cupin 2 domain-containing protein
VSDAPYTRGRLHDPADAPATGEATDALAHLGGTVIEQIRSGRLGAPVDYLADVDEWVVLLAGAATLEVGGDTLDLVTGDWVLLPAGTPHRLMSTAPGTNWLTVTATTNAGAPPMPPALPA